MGFKQGDFRRLKPRQCAGCGQLLEMWEDRVCGTCQLVDALHEPDVIELIPNGMKKVAAEVNTS